MPLLENCGLHHSARFISVWLHVKEDFHAFPASWKSQLRENLGSWLPVYRGMINAACRFAAPSQAQVQAIAHIHFVSLIWALCLSVSPDICKCFCFGMSSLQCLGLRSISINFSMWGLLQGKEQIHQKHSVWDLHGSRALQTATGLFFTIISFQTCP